MPFKSEKQRRYLWANEPEIARDWTDTYGSRIKKDDGGIANTKTIKDQPHMLAYITPNEVDKLKTLGGQETITPEGIPAYPEWDSMYGAESKEAFDEGVAPRGSWSPSGGDPTGKPITSDQLKEINIQQKNILKADKPKPKYLPEFLYNINKKFFANKLLGSKNYSYKSIRDRLAGGETLEDIEEEYWTARREGSIDAYGNPTSTGGGGGESRYPLDVHPGTGGTEVAEVVEDTPSAFQASLTGTADTPDYYVGENPLASNVAWGKAYGVDPRTMGMTSFAAHGGRIPAAYGGIMDTTTGRRAYGFGSFFKKIGRAAKKVFKSPIGKAALMYGLGTGLGSFMPGGTGQGLGRFALGNAKQNLGALFLRSKAPKSWDMTEKAFGALPWYKKINPMTAIGAASALPFFMGGKDEEDDEGIDYDLLKNQYAQELMRIKRGVSAGSLNPDQWSYLPSDYTYTGAEGGRAGYYAGGQSTPSDYTMEDAMMTTTQDKLGGITDVMKQADLHRQGSVGQFYAADGGSPNDDKLMARVKELQDEGLDFNSAMAQAMKELSSGKAQGGRIGYAHGSAGYPPVTMGQPIQAPQMAAAPQQPNPMPAPQPNQMARMNPMMNRPMMNPMGGRRMAQEGGLMDLGGMEKDYRNDGGFVPLGGEEKADDVPARLSKNEFVFTADAVRGAGDGDIDKGAEIMENIMKNLEQGGQISEETQGLSGAQEMFGVSERLSEVV